MIFAMPGNEAMANAVARLAGAERGKAEMRRFPDGETYVRVLSDVRGKSTDIVCTLARPDAQIVGLFLLAGALREWGAVHVRLIAPYLAYLRQDQHFQPGESLSAAHFARLISMHFDSLVTVDPHLHRIKTLAEVYPIPARAAQSAPLIGAWIRAHVQRPILIGPDSESRQWVAGAAHAAGGEYLVLEKTRHGDRAVELAWPATSQPLGRTPVIVDDIVSSGETLARVAEGLAARGFAKPVAALVHALLDDDAYAKLSQICAGVVSTDAVAHASNAISIAELLV